MWLTGVAHRDVVQPGKSKSATDRHPITLSAAHQCPERTGAQDAKQLAALAELFGGVDGSP
jgi:hypothetical protein